jgi:hypothetical protein
MSNIFKSNSRFAVLSDDFKKEKLEKKDNNNNNNNNSFKSNFSDSNSFNSFKTSFSDRNKNIYNDKLKKKLEEDERIKVESLSLDSFPEFIKSKTPTNISNSISFLDKVNKKTEAEKQDTIIDLEYETLQPGWILIKHNISTGETTIKSKHIPLETPKPIEKTDSEIAFETIDALVKLHHKKTDEYIDLYGYETWEKTFLFPNHDYEYFDKLDEIYYDELEKEQQLQNIINMQNKISTERDIYFNDKKKVDYRSNINI